MEEVKTYEVEVNIIRSNMVKQETAENQVITDLFDVKGDYDKWIYNVVAVKELKEDKTDYLRLFNEFAGDIAEKLKDTGLSDYKLKELGLVFEKHLEKVKESIK